MTQQDIYANFNSNGYIGSAIHKHNAAVARSKALSYKEICKFCGKLMCRSGIVKHQKACINNPINSTQCLQCNKNISYRLTFCSSSCAAIYSNARRPKFPKRIKNGKSIKVQFPKCSFCATLFCVRGHGKHRYTCSYKCATELGISKCIRTKRFKYRTLEGTEVSMQSNWEVTLAAFLDANALKWIRPNYIDWVDVNHKKRRYFPDFYLPDFDLFLDPKNPYVMKLDAYKMKVISDKVNILYGDLQFIKDTLIQHCVKARGLEPPL